MKRLVAAGVGRHNKEEIINIGLEDIRALSRCLGSKKFFGGEQAQRVSSQFFDQKLDIFSHFFKEVLF